MDSQRFDMSVKQPIPVRAKYPQVLTLDGTDEECLSRYPSPPPPTPCIPRRRTPLDAQRYDPFKTMLAATSPPRYPSPDPSDPASYPALRDSVAFPLPLPGDAYDGLLAYHLGAHDSPSTDSLTESDSEDTTPTDDSAGGLLTGRAGVTTTFHRIGASEDGDFAIEHKIVRPAPRRSFRADLSRSLASLAARSTATLRTMPSRSQLSGDTTPTSPEEDEEKDGGFVAPPASAVASRRPSFASAPLALGEVTESLKRFASRIVPHASGSNGQPVDSGHFEETVDRYEDAWTRAEAGESLVEVFVTREHGTLIEDRERSGFDQELAAVLGGAGRWGDRGVGIYA